MAFDAKVGSQSLSGKQVIDSSHPAIIQGMKVKVNNGELAKGLIVARDSNGDIVAYDPAGADPLNVPVGVLTVGIDTSKETTGNVLRHGTVVRDSLLAGAVAPTEADIAKLEAIGIFAI